MSAMFFPVLINGTLALMWGAMYLHTHTPYTLFASGVATGGAITLATLVLMDKRYRNGR